VRVNERVSERANQEKMKKNGCFQANKETTSYVVSITYNVLLTGRFSLAEAGLNGAAVTHVHSLQLSRLGFVTVEVDVHFPFETVSVGVAVDEGLAVAVVAFFPLLHGVALDVDVGRGSLLGAAPWPTLCSPPCVVSPSR